MENRKYHLQMLDFPFCYFSLFSLSFFFGGGGTYWVLKLNTAIADKWIVMVNEQGPA